MFFSVLYVRPFLFLSVLLTFHVKSNVIYFSLVSLLTSSKVMMMKRQPSYMDSNFYIECLKVVTEVPLLTVDVNVCSKS